MGRNISKVFSVLWMLLFCSQTALTQSQPSAKDFLQQPYEYGAQLSLDGRYVAFHQRKRDDYCYDADSKIVKADEPACKDKEIKSQITRLLLILDIDTGQVKRSMQIPSSYSVSWIKFVNKERLLISIKQPSFFFGQFTVIGNAKIISVNITESNQGEKPHIRLFEGQDDVSENALYSKVTNVLPDDPEHILIPAWSDEKLDLWKVNVNTGKGIPVERGKDDTFSWYTDADGKAVLRFDCKGRRCKKVRVYAPDPETNDWGKIRTFEVKPGEGEDQYDFWPIGPAPNSDEIYVLSDEETDPRRSIKTFNLNTQQYVATVYQHEEYDVASALISRKSGEFAGALYYDDRQRYDFIEPKRKKHHAAIDKYFGHQANITYTGFSDDGEIALLHVSAHNDPGGYFVYHYNETDIQPLFDTHPKLKEKLNSDAEILKIEMRDDVKIPVYHYYPKGKKYSNLPLIVMPHGGPEVRDYFDYDKWVQYFVAQGYQVIQMNFRGSSGYGKEFAKAGYKQWGGVMQDDVTDTVKYFHDQNLAKANNTCLVGYSYGGYVALYGAMATPELYKCFVSGAGISDLLYSLKKGKSEHGKSSEIYSYWIRSKGDPKTDKDMLETKSPINFADKFEAPILLIHGELDENVRYKQSKNMNKALEKAGKDVEFLTLENEGHSGWSTENETLYLETVKNFLDKHIGR